MTVSSLTAAPSKALFRDLTCRSCSNVLLDPFAQKHCLHCGDAVLVNQCTCGRPVPHKSDGSLYNHCSTCGAGTDGLEIKRPKIRLWAEEDLDIKCRCPCAGKTCTGKNATNDTDSQPPSKQQQFTYQQTPIFAKKRKRAKIKSNYSSDSEVIVLKPPTTARPNSDSTPMTLPCAPQTTEVSSPASIYSPTAETSIYTDVTPSAQVVESPLDKMEQEDNFIDLYNTDNQIDVMAALSRIEGKFDAAMKELKEKLDVVCNEVLKLQEIAREKTSGNEISQNDLSQFTIAEDVCSFSTEEPLMLQRKLGQLGGATARNCVSNILNSLMTNEVMTQLSVYGRGPMKKLPLKDTALYQIIIDAVVSKYPETDHSAVCHMVMEHLKQAKNRLLKEKNRDVKTASI